MGSASPRQGKLPPWSAAPRSALQQENPTATSPCEQPQPHASIFGGLLDSTPAIHLALSRHRCSARLSAFKAERV